MRVGRGQHLKRAGTAIHHGNRFFQLGNCLIRLIVNNQTDQAIPELEKTVAMMNRSPGSLEMLATAYAHAGRRKDAFSLINELKKRRQRDYVPSGAFITPYLALDDYDQAFFWFDEAYKEQSAILQWLKVDP